MMIAVGGKEFRTLADEMFVNGSKVREVYVNGTLVYPDGRDETLEPYYVIATGEADSDLMYMYNYYFGHVRVKVTWVVRFMLDKHKPHGGIDNTGITIYQGDNSRNSYVRASLRAAYYAWDYDEVFYDPPEAWQMFEFEFSDIPDSVVSDNTTWVPLDFYTQMNGVAYGTKRYYNVKDYGGNWGIWQNYLDADDLGFDADGANGTIVLPSNFDAVVERVSIYSNDPDYNNGKSRSRTDLYLPTHNLSSRFYLYTEFMSIGTTIYMFANSTSTNGSVGIKNLEMPLISIVPSDARIIMPGEDVPPFVAELEALGEYRGSLQRMG